MDNYEPNSHKYKEEKTSHEEKKKVEKVVSGVVKTKKKSEIKKVADIFISEDIQNVKSYILMDVLVPAIKKAVSDIVTNGIDMILYGGKGSLSSKVSYRNYYDRKDDYRPYNNPLTRAAYDTEDIILQTRGEAEEVLARMDELISCYGVVSVADLYDLIGKTCSYTSNKYGWTNIRSAEVIRARDGYVIKMPKASPLN